MRSRLPWIVALVAVVAIALVALAVVLVGGDDDAEAAEIFLEPAAGAGADPFATGLKGPATPVSTTTMKPTGTNAPATVSTTAGSGGVTATRSVSGGSPGLYGGTRNNAVCDPVEQADFLAKNPPIAAAFVAALNADPSMRWSGGDKLTVAQIGTYLRELTPLILTSDTRVTNHGYRNGKPTARHAVLQAGTAVLVDAYGVPRVKCNCGNPLTAPTPVKRTPRYTGTSWPGFAPESIVVVQVTQVQIDVFVVVDVVTGEPFSRPAGTTGGEDADADLPSDVDPGAPDGAGPDGTPPASTDATDTTATTRPPAPPGGDQNAFCARWAQLAEQYREIDPTVPEIVAIFDELIDLAPPEIRPQVEVVGAAVREAAARGASDVSLGDDPQTDAAIGGLLIYLQDTCGLTEFG